MIEKDLLVYLQSKTTLTNKLGAVNKIQVVQAPTTGLEMPWLLIENAGGTRLQISATKIEVRSTIRISVDAGPNQLVVGREAADIAMRLLENYRGKLGDANDIHAVCSDIRSFPGLLGVYKYQFDCQMRWTEAYAVPS